MKKQPTKKNPRAGKEPDDLANYDPSAKELDHVEHTFALAYLTNGFSQTEAWQQTHRDVKRTTCRVEGCRMMQRPHVKRFIAERLEQAWAKHQMGAEEALGRLAELARCDIGDFYDDQNQLLAVHDWPAAARRAVKEVKWDENKVVVHDKQQPLRTILEVSGKVKGAGQETVDALAAAIMADVSRREGKK